MGGDASGVDAGLIGLFVLVVLFVAAGLLGASMLRHVRRVPPSFEPQRGRGDRRDGRAPADGAPTDGAPADEAPADGAPER